MIDAARLLADLKRLRRWLDADLRQTHAASAGRAAVEAEWRAAREAGRTAETFETFFDAALDQTGVHWVLACVFLRFLEDNGLVERPVLGGPGERLDLARERHASYFRQHPHDSDLDYLLDAFAEAARLPGLSVLFDPAHNPLFRLPVSGDGAIALREFFQTVVPETGAPVHDFTDPDWNTRFLGDLYQDLSEEARKRFALLQTPEFVETWILDRTLEPAIREFGFREVRMIDPACGSGHFLLGGFARVLREWERHMPDMPPAARAQRALEAVAGVDVNPFAVEIARFRLLLAALRAAGVARLRHAPDLRMTIAAGDSLLHGRHFFRGELGGASEGFRRTLRHHYEAEDTAELDRVLGRQYHAVVGNPPYITPKDPAMRKAYREIYESCHMKYALAAPFIERFFDLAQSGMREQASGFVGMIVGNNFMKRDFGRKLIEDVLPRLDLTHIVNCDGVAIPGHGTPTAILFGRNRAPIASIVRTVMGIKGDPPNVANAGSGPTWTAIVAQTDQVGSVSDFVSVSDVLRTTLTRHPWSIGGGGASELNALIEGDRPHLASRASVIGVFGMTNADEAMLANAASFARTGCEAPVVRPLVVGDAVRDWRVTSVGSVVFPYTGDALVALTTIPKANRWLWPSRTTMGNRATFSQRTYFAEGRPWWEWHQVALERLTGSTITLAFVATHNHFVLDRGGKVFNRSAPIIKLAPDASEDSHLALLGLLNSSTACFWMKAVMHNKGGQGVNEGTKAELWERFIEVTSTAVEKFPLADSPPLDLAGALDNTAQRLSENLPAVVVARATPTYAALDTARAAAASARAAMIALQEELDWRCYNLYGLLDNAPEHPDPPPLALGQRAFEIVMARRMAAGELETAWFTRHRSTPITELPTHWPAEYRVVVERRIALIESDANIGLIERPEYKRRWSLDSWEDMEQTALRTWLLDRLEDRRLWTDPAELLSTNQIADRIRRDADFMAVAALYTGREDFGLEALVADLVARESVPFLASMRYAETGLRKRAQWEETWRLQRREDAIDAEIAANRAKFLVRAEAHAQETWRSVNPRRGDETPETYALRMVAGVTHSAIEAEAERMIEAEQKRRKKAEVGDIPVPPKYRSADFLSQDFWRLRGGLDVPKERFVSFPRCSPDADGSLVVTWAGYDYLARATAIGTTYQSRKDEEGWPAERLTPLLAGLQELLPWLIQWHDDYNAAIGGGMGDYFADLVREEARVLGLTEAALAAWQPPVRPRRARGPRTRTPTA